MAGRNFFVAQEVLVRKGLLLLPGGNHASPGQYSYFPESVMSLPRQYSYCPGTAQEMASQFLGNTHIAQEVTSLYGIYVRDGAGFSTAW